MLTLILLFSFIAPPAQAASPSVPIDRCQQQCSLERGENGRAYVSCSCEKKRGGVTTRDLASWVATRKAFPAENAPDAIGQIQRCEAGRRSHPGFTNAAELKALASREALPLCDCVEARIHLPVERRCVRQRTGELGCTFHPDFNRPSVGRALRKPTVEDYQSCLVASANYQKPLTCGEANRCDARMPSCAAGEEVFNEADPEACCPVFVCRKGQA